MDENKGTEVKTPEEWTRAMTRRASEERARYEGRWYHPINRNTLNGDRPMLSITEFLEARITEDEALANNARGLLGIETDWWDWEVLARRADAITRSDAKHMARHSPSRVLAECAAKRAIMRMHRLSSVGLCVSCADAGPDSEGFPCDTLRTLTAAHKDHPAYRKEWA